MKYTVEIREMNNINNFYVDVIEKLDFNDIQFPANALRIFPNKRGVYAILYFDVFKVTIYESAYYSTAL